MNKRKSKNLLLLLGVLAVISAVTFGVSRYEKHVEKIRSTDETIFSIDPAAVTALSWVNGSETLSFHKDGENWVYDGDSAFPVDPDKIETLLSVFKEFGACYVITDVENYSDYGLADPTCTIGITADGEDYTVLLGGFSTMDKQRYVSIGDGNAYLVQTDPYESFNVALSDMILNDKVPGVEKATKIDISGVDAYEILYEENSGKSSNEEDVYFAGGRPLDTFKVSTYLQTVSSISLTEYAQYDASADSLEQYGLDEPELTLKITYPPAEESEASSSAAKESEASSSAVKESEASSSGNAAENETSVGNETSEVFTLSVSRNREEVDRALQSKEENALESVAAYARVGDSPIIYKITSQEYEELVASTYNDLRHAAVINAASEDITQIDIVLEGETYVLTCKGSGENRKWYLGEEELEDILTLQSAIEALTAQDADSFCDQMPDSSMKEEIRMTVHLDNENFPQIETAFYRYDGTNCLATVDGEPFAYITRDKVVSLIEAVYGIVLR